MVEIEEQKHSEMAKELNNIIYEKLCVPFKGCEVD